MFEKLGGVTFEKSEFDVPNGPWNGLPRELWARLVAELAGSAAEERILLDAHNSARHWDKLHVASFLTSRGVGEVAQSHLLRYLEQEASDFVDRHARKIDEVAAHLRDMTTVAGEPLRNLLGG
jgi:hypothetical protein